MDIGRSDRASGNLIFYFTLTLIVWLLWIVAAGIVITGNPAPLEGSERPGGMIA